MCKLLYCELLKYKRTKAIPLLTALSALFPLALLVFTGSDLRGAATLAEQRAYYDGLFNNSLVYSSLLLFPCLFGCISAILFFTERDCDTFKNLRVVPVTRNALIFAKLGALYLWSAVYSVCSVLSATLFCFLCQPAAVYDVLFKVLCSIVTAIAMATVSLPVVVIVVYQNQNYVLSSLLSFFVCRSQLAAFDYFFLQRQRAALAADHERISVHLPPLGVAKGGAGARRTGSVIARDVSARGAVSGGAVSPVCRFDRAFL